MSSSALVETAGCSHIDCADSGHVTLRFPKGSKAQYCEYHANHLARMDGVEVVR